LSLASADSPVTIITFGSIFHHILPSPPVLEIVGRFFSGDTYHQQGVALRPFSLLFYLNIL
jgi:hypothetical protein